MSALEWLGYEWARPLGFAALIALPIVWWLASRSARPPRVSTGTLEVWREVTREQPIASETRRATSPALWALLASLACGAFALAGPRDVSAAGPVTWRVVVDRSPSMYLQLDSASGETRIERALAMAREQLASAARPGDDFEWTPANGVFSTSQRALAPPDEWLVAPTFPHAAPRFELFDRPGTLFVTDAQPQPEPRDAGWCACGGKSAPGLIAARGPSNFWWLGGSEYHAMGINGQRWFARWPEFAAAAPPLRDVFKAWSAARLVNRVETLGDSAGVKARIGVEISSASEGEVVDVRAARDGWSLRGTARAVQADPEEPSESWLAARQPDGSMIDVVRWRPGRIEIGFEEVSAPEGDSAAFAVSWAKLFDAAMLPPPGVVAVDERQAAGQPSSRAPVRPATRDSPEERPHDAWFALAATACAVLALVLRR